MNVIFKKIKNTTYYELVFDNKYIGSVCKSENRLYIYKPFEYITLDEIAMVQIANKLKELNNELKGD